MSNTIALRLTRQQLENLDYALNIHPPHRYGLAREEALELRSIVGVELEALKKVPVSAESKS